MSYTKPILAVSSAALGAALVLMATTIQRDRFAFTEVDARTIGAPAAAGAVAPALPVAVPETTLVESDARALRIEAIEVRASRPAPSKPRKAVTPRVEPAKLPCQPTWRELEAGPAGGMVREICDRAPLTGLPQS
jgi:hypothetical protein